MVSHIISKIWNLWNSDDRIRFLVVGGWNTVFGYSVYVFSYLIYSPILPEIFFSYTLAMITSQVVSLFHNFFTHKNFTFRSSATKANSLRSEFFRFASAYFTLYIVSLILLPILVELVGLHPLPAGIVIIIVVYLFGGFFVHKNYSFKSYN